MKTFTQRSVLELQPVDFRHVQLGLRRLVLTQCGKLIGFLLPLEDVSPKSGVPIAQSLEIPLTQFRHDLAKDKHICLVDCIYLTSRTRRVAAFVAPHLWPHLSLPIIGESNAITRMNK